MKILMTGASGFIGNELYKSSTTKESFRCVIRGSENNRYSDCFKISSLNASTDWSGAFECIDAVIHLAGLAHSKEFTEQDYKSVNVDGTLHLAREAAKSGVKRFVFVSSIGINGSSSGKTPFCENSPDKPHDPYSCSKLEAEKGLKLISQQTGLEVVIVRPTLVYGANAPGNFGRLCMLVSKSPVLPFGLVNNKRDFIAVQNLAELLLVCATHPNAAGNTFLASDGQGISVEMFTHAIAEGLEKNIIQLPVPIFIMRFVGKLLGKTSMVEQLVGNLEVDSSKIVRVLGWKPPYTLKQAMCSLSEKSK